MDEKSNSILKKKKNSNLPEVNNTNVIQGKAIYAGGHQQNGPPGVVRVTQPMKTTMPKKK